MKTYYISYKETIKLFGGETYEEFGEKIISAKNKKEAIIKLVNLTEGSVEIDQLYQTTEDARI